MKNKNSKSNGAKKNSPKFGGDAVGDAYKVKESYKTFGKPDRIPAQSKADDSYGSV